MKLDLLQTITGWNGVPVIRAEPKRDAGGFPVFAKSKDGEILRDQSSGQQVIDSEMQPVTLRNVISEVIDAQNQDDTSETKQRQAMLMQKVWSGKEATFTTEQAAFIISRAEKFAPLRWVVILKELLDPESLKEEEPKE